MKKFNGGIDETHSALPDSDKNIESIENQLVKFLTDGYVLDALDLLSKNSENYSNEFSKKVIDAVRVCIKKRLYYNDSAGVKLLMDKFSVSVDSINDELTETYCRICSMMSMRPYLVEEVFKELPLNAEFYKQKAVIEMFSQLVKNSIENGTYYSIPFELFEKAEIYSDVYNKDDLTNFIISQINKGNVELFFEAPIAFEITIGKSELGPISLQALNGAKKKICDRVSDIKFHSNNEVDKGRDITKEYISIFGIEPGFFESEEFKASVLRGYKKALSLGEICDSYFVKSIMGLGVNRNIFLEPKMKEVAFKSLIKDLSGRRLFIEVINFFELIKYPKDEILSSIAFSEALKENFMGYMDLRENNGNFTFAYFYNNLMTFGVPKKLISEVAYPGLIRFISKLDVGGISEILSIDPDLVNRALLAENFTDLTKSVRDGFIASVTAEPRTFFDAYNYFKGKFGKVISEIINGDTKSLSIIEQKLFSLSLGYDTSNEEIAALCNEFSLDIHKFFSLEGCSLMENFRILLQIELPQNKYYPFIKKMRDIVDFNSNVTNVENNPWHTDILPLMQTIVAKLGEDFILNHQEHLLTYLREIGPINSFDLFSLVVRLMNKELLDDETQVLKELGMQNMTIGELRIAMDNIQNSILSNKINKENISLDNPIVYDIFRAKFVLSSQWDRDINKEGWVELSEDSYVIPEYLDKASELNIEVQKTRKINSNELQEYLLSKTFDEVVLKKRSMLKDSLSSTREQLVEKYMGLFMRDINSVSRALEIENLENSSEKWEEYIQEAGDVQEEQKRKNLRAKLTNPITAKALTLQVEKSTKIFAEVEKLRSVDLETLISFLLPHKNLSDLCNALIIHKIFQNEEIQNFKTDLVSDSIDNVKYAKILGEFMNHAVKEHVLPWLENKEMGERISSMFGLVKGKDTHKNAIEVVIDTVQKLTQTEVIEKEVVKFDLIPVSGLARLTAGNIGDACYTSRVTEIHNNINYERLHAFLFARKDAKNLLSLKGSCLLIETEDLDGNTVFVIRANNPREGFLMSMSEKAQQALVDETINSFKGYAQEYSKRTGKPAKVAIIDDRASESSTNRKGVWDAYRKYCNGKTIEVVDEPVTRFNSYNLNETVLYEV